MKKFIAFLLGLAIIMAVSITRAQAQTPNHSPVFTMSFEVGDHMDVMQYTSYNMDTTVGVWLTGHQAGIFVEVRLGNVKPAQVVQDLGLLPDWWTAQVAPCGTGALVTLNPGKDPGKALKLLSTVLRGTYAHFYGIAIVQDYNRVLMAASK